ncbi:hypothetical protein KM043_003137 [Ampulex compressa]|nr:hypothetical protein KM043_003137 [Ampulex compressa]
MFRAVPSGARRYLRRGRAETGLEGFQRCRVVAGMDVGVAVQKRPRASLAEGPGSSRLLHRGEEPLLDETLGTALGRAAREWPNRECLVSLHQNVRLTFAELVLRADRLAAGLKKLGLERGDRVGIWGPNDVEWLIASSAASRGGFVAVCINPAYRPAELSHCLRLVGPRAVVSPRTFKTQDYAGMLLDAKRTCPDLRHLVVYSEEHVAGTHRFSDVEGAPTRIEVEAIGAEQDRTDCREGCNLQFTSGTTGKPKATLLSHRSVLNNARQGARRGELKEGTRICLNVPFFHAFALLMGQVGSIHSGGALVLPARSFDPVKGLKAMAEEKCSAAYGTPTMWINLMDAQDRLSVPGVDLSIGVTGGATAPPELFRRISEVFRLENVKTIYGLTEVTGIAFQSLPAEERSLREGTVGHLSDHVEAMVVDEAGLAVPFGSPGELWLRGYSTMLGYWGDEENTRAMITEDGWLKTGDRFALRADGYGHIIGRIKDVVIRGGENIFPKEIEDLLMTHPEVLEAHVIGAFDPLYGEEVCACVKPRKGARLTADQLKDHCRGKIAHFKIPRYVLFVDEYPKTGSGKVQKNLLREEMERRGSIPTEPR